MKNRIFGSRPGVFIDSPARDWDSLRHESLDVPAFNSMYLTGSIVRNDMRAVVWELEAELP